MSELTDLIDEELAEVHASVLELRRLAEAHPLRETLLGHAQQNGLPEKPTPNGTWESYESSIRELEQALKTKVPKAKHFASAREYVFREEKDRNNKIDTIFEPVARVLTGLGGFATLLPYTHGADTNIAAIGLGATALAYTADALGPSKIKKILAVGATLPVQADLWRQYIKINEKFSEMQGTFIEATRESLRGTTYNDLARIFQWKQVDKVEDMVEYGLVSVEEIQRMDVHAGGESFIVRTYDYLIRGVEQAKELSLELALAATGGLILGGLTREIGHVLKKSSKYEKLMDEVDTMASISATGRSRLQTLADVVDNSKGIERKQMDEAVCLGIEYIQGDIAPDEYRRQVWDLRPKPIIETAVREVIGNGQTKRRKLQFHPEATPTRQPKEEDIRQYEERLEKIGYDSTIVRALLLHGMKLGGSKQVRGGQYHAWQQVQEYTAHHLGGLQERELLKTVKKLIRDEVILVYKKSNHGKLGGPLRLNPHIQNMKQPFEQYVPALERQRATYLNA